MLGSIIVTAMLNKVFNKLYIPPLIINAVSIILLFVGIGLNMKNMTYAMYFNYIPTVMASIFYNSIIFIVRKIKYNAKKLIKFKAIILLHSKFDTYT